MGFRRRTGYMAGNLRRSYPIGHKRKRWWRIVPKLSIEARPINGPAIETRRRTGFQPTERKSRPVKRLGKPEFWIYDCETANRRFLSN